MTWLLAKARKQSSKGQRMAEVRDLSNWEGMPMPLEQWPTDAEYTMFIDENNHPGQMSRAVKLLSEGQPMEVNDRYLTVTGCVFNKHSYWELARNIEGLKYKYWPGGMFYQKGTNKEQNVCFHSSCIRNMRAPFDSIDYNGFITDLSNFIKNADFQIFSVTIDMYEHARRYATNPHHPYSLAMEFLFERFAGFHLEKENSKGIVVLERRGKKEDKALLKHIKQTLDNGTYYVASQRMQRVIGVYFNPKCFCSPRMSNY